MKSIDPSTGEVIGNFEEHSAEHVEQLLRRADESQRRWRDVAKTVVSHADDLVRVGNFEQAWLLAEAVAERAAARPDRQPHARASLEQFASGSMLKHAAAQLRGTSDEGYE